MSRRLWGLFSGIFCAMAVTGCGVAEEPVIEDTEIQKVELVVWGAEEDKELMEQIIQSFQANYQGQADFEISFEAQGESQCKDVLLGGLEEGADVFTFADDQLNALAAAGALDPIENADEIRSRNLSSTVEAATVNDQLYAYPLTADNGYFLYYNKRLTSIYIYIGRIILIIRFVVLIFTPKPIYTKNIGGISKNIGTKPCTISVCLEII